MATFEQFLSTFSTNPNIKGEQFEYFVKEFLKNDSYWKSIVKEVWMFEDAPINWGTDTGTDLIFKDFEGQYWAVQAKNYAPEYSVTKGDIHSFLSDSNRSIIHKRLLIIATNKIGSHGLKTIKDQEKEVVVFRLQDFEDRGDVYPDSFSDLLKFKLPEPPKRLPHQQEAINDVVRGFQKSSKGQLIMACGTGKTYTYFWIHKELQSNKTLVLVPSLNLLSQTLQEWIKANGSSFRSLCICSDPTTVKNVQEDEIILEQSDLPYSVSWDVDVITSFLKRPEPTVIFSTYQSSGLIEEAQKNVPNHIFDLSVADEAHRCTVDLKAKATSRKANSEFITILDDQKIRSHKKLFGTATPKLFKPYVKKAAEEKEIEIIDMNDEDKFGSVLHNLSFGKAIKENLLADYQVIVVGVNDSRVKEMIDQREFISIKEDHKSDAASLGAQVGFIKAIKDHNLSRLVTFHGRVEKASDFSKSLPEIFKWTKSEYKGNKELDIDYVSGKMQTSERRRKLNELKNIGSNQIGILSNARCLGEGVDVPYMDGIAFIDPKSSEIDIVQCVGRAIRKPDDNKSIGYIILPVFIVDKDTVEESIESSAFEPVWKVMNALKSHDDDFKLELDNLRMNLGKNGITGRPPKFVFDLPTKITSTFQDKVETYLIEKVTESWYFYFGLLEQYYSEFGTSRIKGRDEYKGFNLGNWVLRQRTSFNMDKSSKRYKKYSKKRSDLLEKTFPDWSWDILEDTWLKYFQVLNEYYLEFGTSRVSAQEIYKDLNLGDWVNTQRTSFKRDERSKDKKLSKEKGDLLEKTFPDWSWGLDDDTWLKHFEALKEYNIEFGTSRIPSKDVYKDLNLGDWVIRQRSAFRRDESSKKKTKLSKERSDLLEETFPDWSWDLDDDTWLKHFEALKEYDKEFRTSRIKGRDEYKDLPLGTWVRRQRTVFKKDKLSKEKSDLLEETFPDWTWNLNEDLWLKHFEALKEYNKEFGSSRVKAQIVYKGLPLGKWIATQRTTFKKDKLSKEKSDRLEQTFPDWSWKLR